MKKLGKELVKEIEIIIVRQSNKLFHYIYCEGVGVRGWGYTAVTYKMFHVERFTVSKRVAVASLGLIDMI